MCLFVATSGYILFQANGWTLVHGRIIRAAGLFIESDPRSTITINGQAVGTTPYRTTRLEAGIVTIALARPGYTSWVSSIPLVAGKSTDVVDIHLQPTPVITTITELTATDRVLHDSESRITFVTRPNNDQFTVELLDPELWSQTPLSLPFSPKHLRVSDDGEYLYADNGDTAMVITDPSTPRSQSVPMMDYAAWSPDGDPLLFGIVRGRLVVVNAALGSFEQMGPADSLVVAKGALWTITATDTGGQLQRWEPYPAAKAQVIHTFPTDMTLLPVDRDTVIAQEVSTHAGWRVTGSTALVWQLEPLGSTVRILSTRPLLWSDGVSVRTRGSAGQHPFIDRVGGILWAAWYRGSNGLVVSDGRQLVGYTRQANDQFGVVARDTLPVTAEFLGPHSDGRGFYFRLGSVIRSWSLPLS